MKSQQRQKTPAFNSILKSSPWLSNGQLLFTRLKQFSNGRYEYIPFDNLHLQYGKKGLFASLDIGVSWKIGEKNRMNAGVSAGLSQSYYSTCLKTNYNRFLQFGKEDYLPYEEGQVFIRTIGQQDFWDRFELDVKVKICFAF